MNSRNETHFSIQNPFSNLGVFNTSGDPVLTAKQPEMLAIQSESNEDSLNEENKLYPDETEQNTVIQADSMRSDDEEPEVKPPGRKTKRKRRVVTDISNLTRRTTRSTTRKSELSQSNSDIEML